MRPEPPADDLPSYLHPWIGVIPMHELQAGAHAAREHQQYPRDEDRPGDGQGTSQQGTGQQDRADTPGDGWGWGR